MWLLLLLFPLAPAVFETGGPSMLIAPLLALCRKFELELALEFDRCRINVAIFVVTFPFMFVFKFPPPDWLSGGRTVNCNGIGFGGSFQNKVTRNIIETVWLLTSGIPTLHTITWWRMVCF